MPAEALKQLGQLAVAHRGVDRRVGDLVPVDVQERQHRSARGGIQELVGMPRAGRRTRLRLAVAHDARHDQVGVVERRAERGRQRVPQLPALVNRSGHDRRQMAREATGPGEVAHQPRQPLPVARQLGLDVLQASVDPQVGQVGGRAVARAGDEQDACIGVEDQAVQPGVDEVDAGHRAPVTEQPWLDVRRVQRLLEHVIATEVDHRRGYVVGRATVQLQPFGCARLCLGGQPASSFPGALDEPTLPD